MATRWRAMAWWCVAVVAVFVPWVAQGVERQPNVVLVMADDLGWGDCGYQGHPHLKTPHLDAMAAAGLRFNRFYAAAPVCSPTRGSCLTGRHPYRYGILHANVGHLPGEEVTLAELLADAGYATGHFGKWHLGTLTTSQPDGNRGGSRGAAHFAPPWLRGFQTCFSTESKVPTWDPLLQPAGNRSGTWWDPVADRAMAEPYGTAYWTPEGPVTDDLRGDDSRLIMDRAVAFVERHAGPRPFLAVIWFHAPHLPVVAGPDYTAPYAEFDRYTQHYYGCIAALDEQVGRLRRVLRSSGAADNTMLWFCADNGPEGAAGRAPGSAGALRGRKRDLWEGGIRVPGLVEWPGHVAAGSATDVPASTSDYLPTVLDAVGLTMPDDRPLDGVSLLPLLAQTTTERGVPIGFESGQQQAWIDGDWKLVRNPRGTFLYNLATDQSEQRDLAAEQPQRLSAMLAALEDWQASCTVSRAGKDY